MNTKVMVDVFKIKEEIKSKHDAFIKVYGTLSEKAAADQKFLADIIFSRLHLIAICFKEEKIIDEIKLIDGLPLKKLCLFKGSFTNYVNVTTNGKSILLEGYTYTINHFGSDVVAFKKVYSDIDVDDYDWVKFSNELVAFIHDTIYERKEVSEMRIKNYFKDEDTDKAINVTKKKAIKK